MTQRTCSSWSLVLHRIHNNFKKHSSLVVFFLSWCPELILRWVFFSCCFSKPCFVEINLFRQMRFKPQEKWVPKNWKNLIQRQTYSVLEIEWLFNVKTWWNRFTSIISSRSFGYNTFKFSFISFGVKTTMHSLMWVWQVWTEMCNVLWCSWNNAYLTYRGFLKYIKCIINCNVKSFNFTSKTVYTVDSWEL